MKILQYADFEVAQKLLDYVNKEIHRDDVISIVHIKAESSMYTDYLKLFYYEEETASKKTQ